MKKIIIITKNHYHPMQDGGTLSEIKKYCEYLENKICEVN